LNITQNKVPTLQHREKEGKTKTETKNAPKNFRTVLKFTTYMWLESQNEKTVKKTEKIFEKIMANDFLKLMIDNK